ncbi:ASKHA domain-containing protein [Candidatus Methylospira mobilis]|uniref:ASKHA domain-containing protein n=1 Tax=Candidatus Methylospira mobilis TaxID=1808979 RepID=UPI0028EB2D9A|nr:ASKHA domain-containing protein [Candidatus Methylospira mobilis]WNV04556.1 ASKHA domain-containing protein [Candidatus Methylospira mobilis]
MNINMRNAQTDDTALPVIAVQMADGEHRIPFCAGPTLRDILISAGIPLPSACDGKALCGLCRVILTESAAIPFTTGELLCLSYPHRGEGLRLACQIRPDAGLHVILAPPVAQTQWRALREDEYTPTAYPPVQQSSDSDAPYGVAIDLGTTHIRLSLWSLAEGKRIAGRVGLNPQIGYGTDVLARLTAASHSLSQAQAIGALAQQAIGAALAEMASVAAIRLNAIGKLAIVGNTAMLSLLAGKNYDLLLQTEYWTRRIDCQPDDVDFLRAVWQVSGPAVIRFVPPLGGFIGSDLLAGVIATHLIAQPAYSLLIDFGTNSEIALWDGRLLHVTSTAGGPAFEGCGISCGMPGETGAIYRVWQDDNGTLAMSVLGDVQPAGVCGSGLVDIIAWLRRTGKLDKVGRFRDGIDEGYVLSDIDEPIMLRKRDIDAFQRAKAAIAAGIRWLCDLSGIRPSELERVTVCGAFGRLLDVGNAREIGLIPGIAADKVMLEGNVVLAGCEALLVSDAAEELLQTVQSLARIHNLAEDAAFEHLFVENLYLQPMRDAS